MFFGLFFNILDTRICFLAKVKLTL